VVEIYLSILALNTINQPTTLQLVEGNIGNPVSSNNRTNRHDITVILLKVALNNNHALTQLVSGDQYMVEYA
jgi:hypothetical protein